MSNTSSTVAHPTYSAELVHGLTEIARLCVRVIRTGDGASARDIEGVLMGLMTPEIKRQQVESLRANPVLAKLLSERPLLPKGFGPESVDDCEPGTVGHAYATFMRQYDLTQEFFPERDTSDDLEYFRRRMMETHDLWHVLARCPATVPGELGVIGFYVGQFARHLDGPLRVYTGLVLLNCVLGVLHCAHTRPRELASVLVSVARNARRGYRSKPLFGVHWESLWNWPLERVQAALLAD